MLKFNRSWRTAALTLAMLTGVAACGDDDPGPTTPDPLNAPSNVSATRSGRDIQVTWNAVTGADSYVVQRQVGVTGSFSQVAAGVTETSYTDPNPGEGDFLYRVMAVRGTEMSPASEAAGITVRLRAVLSGSISNTRQLSADTLYTLQGLVRVTSGGVLRIPAGTVLQGDVNVTPTALLIEVGGRIEAEGTAAAPIVFTSSKPAGSRARGDWGGVLIAGDSYCSFPQPCNSEGVQTVYGGNDIEDDSGTLRYVRIEFAGYEASPGNELNGLSLFGVGRGTTIEHVQVHYGSDDGIELFGGTVDIKWAITTGNDDDSFDYSTGWQGRGQFWIVQQAENAGDKGFEVDGNENDFNATPLTDPRIFNVTLVGRGVGSSDAMLFRRGTAGIVRNVIAINFAGGAAVDVDDAPTVTHCAPAPILNNIIVFGNSEQFDGDSDTFEATCVGSELRAVDPMLGDPLNRQSPNFVPQAGSPALTGAATPPSDGFFDAANYLGAVAPTGTPWYAGWITTAAN